MPVEFVDGQPVSLDFPGFVDLRVIETALPVLQQQDSTLKSPRVENGVEILVPQFIKVGDTVRIDVADLKYV